MTVREASFPVCIVVNHMSAVCSQPRSSNYGGCVCVARARHLAHTPLSYMPAPRSTRPTRPQGTTASARSLLAPSTTCWLRGPGHHIIHFPHPQQIGQGQRWLAHTRPSVGMPYTWLRARALGRAAGTTSRVRPLRAPLPCPGGNEPTRRRGGREQRSKIKHAPEGGPWSSSSAAFSTCGSTMNRFFFCGAAAAPAIGSSASMTS